ncbi:transcription-repair coupling factor [Aerococcus urinaehominis]|uniref:Transcription-repair-coupling factor n=1 Tax=Aerococcus urinaehominis TaxID=128944 RepID=A0A0X8FKV7_9LACT|nr:transcription-repair coupling factor [Aerococcus urinaehominis]AMB99170.1 transcription-repair coupling factor [Aerococcus urinaehominis]SDM06139.1 transcription-repair coupling factor [Aerococcus urinaehominis]
MHVSDLFLKETKSRDLALDLQDKQAVLYLGLQGAAKAYLDQLIYQHNPDQHLIIVVAHNHQADVLADDLRLFLPDQSIRVFQVGESVAADQAIASPEALSERLQVLQNLASGQPGITIVPVLGLKKLLTPYQRWQELCQTISLGQELTPDQLKQDLIKLGYDQAEIVMKPGEMSARGDIVDFYPLNEPQPIRLSLAFDEVERLSYFDPNSQKSNRDLDHVDLIPVKDFLYQPADLQAASSSLLDQGKDLVAGMKDPELRDQVAAFFQAEVQAWQQGEATPQTNYYHQYIYDQPGNLLDYIDQAILILDDYPRLVEEAAKLDQQAAQLVEAKLREGQILPQQILYANFLDQIRACKKAKIYMSLWQQGLGQIKFDHLHQFQTRPVSQFYDQMDMLKIEIEAWLRTGRTICVYLPDSKKVSDLEDLLAAIDVKAYASDGNNIITNQVNLLVGDLSAGIEFVNEKLVFLAESDIFAVKKKKRRPRQLQISNAERIQSYQQLEPGDYVVHVNHGIGQFVGIETIEVAGVHRDYMTIVFADSAAIHVPIDQIDQVQKYVSSEGKTPKLNKMGGTEWAKTKQKVSSKVEDIADELIELYASREAEQGYAFSPDTPEQADFEQAFPYTETDDQLRSISEIKADMEASKPMDRLLVGDVGFGKTEVAMRAIFKAVMDGKQAAFLVPTTILAQQHFESLTERFQDYPFKIELLSRFRSKKEQDQTVEDLAKGKVDIVVGTHRLLSKDVAFLDLGLLVVDEEQRFGVKDKERLKALKEKVDVLTLTATPIPRTLNMSMLGVRDLSVIETPPANRYPVQTYVIEQNAGVVKDSIEREISRDGQVFYLFNNVAQIEEKAGEIKALVPDAEVGIAHGQMTPIQLENIMLDFIDGVYDVLVTTTIIETGVDIPNANTLIVENANHMGLSTLYQLRGRVGRSNRIAYAYFMYKPDRMLSEISEKRLQALRDFTELGSGFKIAMRDLSIRGAGNLLGKQQHGFMNAIGFDLYSQMLREAVQRKRGILPAVKREPVEIDLAIDAYIPSSYIRDERQKVEMYKRVNQFTTSDDRWELDDEMLDRFGEPPSQVQYLLQVGGLKADSDKIGISSIKRKNKEISLTFYPDLIQKELTPAIFEAMQDIPMRMQIKVDKGRLLVMLNIDKLTIESWLDYLLQFTDRLAQLANRFNPSQSQEEAASHEADQ